MDSKKIKTYLLILSILLIPTTHVGYTHTAAAFLKEWWEKGPLINIEKTPDGKFKYVTGAILINAPVKKVWEVLTDWEAQSEYSPHVLSVQVKKIDAKTFITDYTLQISALNYVVNVKYTSETVLTKPYSRLDYKILKGDIKEGYGFYELVPSGKNKTIFFYGHYIDLSPIPIVKTMMKQDPRVDTLLPVGLTLSILKAVKRQAEK